MQVRQTKQKMRIYETLKSLDHPTATEVYASLRETDPTISRATVFRVLSGFAGSGKALELRMSGRDTRYDYNTHTHYHVHCRECGKVADIDAPILTEFASGVSVCGEGFEVEGYSVEFFGVCKDCKKQEITS